MEQKTSEQQSHVDLSHAQGHSPKEKNPFATEGVSSTAEPSTTNVPFAKEKSSTKNEPSMEEDLCLKENSFADTESEVWELDDSIEEIPEEDYGFREYEKLNSSERRKLRREYFGSVNPHVKLMLIVSNIFLYMLMIASAPILYYFTEFFGGSDLPVLEFIYLIVVPLIASGTMLVGISLGGYEAWLFRRHAVLKSTNYSNRKSIAQALQQNEPMVYRELTRAKKRSLKKQFLAQNRSAKTWWIVAMFLAVGLIVAVCFLGFGAIKQLTSGQDFGAILESFIKLPPHLFFWTLLFYENIYTRFFHWLEFQKNVTIAP